MPFQAGTGRAPAHAPRLIAGFFLSGFLMALAGALLPVWGYHRDPPEFMTVGGYFLCVGAAVILAHRAASWLVRRRKLALMLVGGCFVASGGIMGLAIASPPAAAGWRMLGLAVTGFGAGLVNCGLFYGLAPEYERSMGDTVAKAGALYGLGCLGVTLFVAGMLDTYAVPSLLVLLGVVPAMYGGVFARSGTAAGTLPAEPAFRDVLRDFRSPAAVLLALLLFFQFGNEWSLAGWLPLYLVRRLGISPASGLRLVALYWLALLGGRFGAVYLVGRVRGRKLMPVSALAAIFGLALLSFTNNWFGAATGVVFVGGGFASIFPLVAEHIGSRFPYYHPAFFNGIFSLALMGAMLAPGTLGLFAEAAGIWVVMALPLAGTCMVLLLIVLIWLETKVRG